MIQSLLWLNCFPKQKVSRVLPSEDSMPAYTYTRVCFAQSCSTLCDPMDCSLPRSCPWDSPSKNTGVGCHSLPHEIFLTQGSNPSFLHCRQTLPSEPSGKPPTPPHHIHMGIYQKRKKGKVTPLCTCFFEL